MADSDMSPEEYFKKKAHFAGLVEQDVRHASDMQFNLHRHLTTLSAGTIVILAAFMDRCGGAIPNAGDNSLSYSLMCMIGGVLVGFLGMMTVVIMKRLEVKVAHHISTLADLVEKAKGVTGSTTANTTEESKQENGDKHQPDCKPGMVLFSLLSCASGRKIMGIAECLLSLLGSIIFVVGLVFLSQFIWSNTVVPSKALDSPSPIQAPYLENEGRH